MESAEAIAAKLKAIQEEAKRTAAKDRWLYLQVRRQGALRPITQS